jgi:vacuolar-type H+-ATPase subunit C/Vma6
MRRSHEEIRELVAARVLDFVENAATEDVTRALLKALNVEQGEIDHLIETARRVILKRPDADVERMKDSVVYLTDYLKR